MAAQELLEGAGQLARRARISGLVALCAVELCFLWVSIKSDVKVQRCYFYYKLFRRYGECNGFTPNPGVQRRWLRQRDRMVGEGRVSVCAEGDYTIGSSAHH